MKWIPATIVVIIAATTLFFTFWTSRPKQSEKTTEMAYQPMMNSLGDLNQILKSDPGGLMSVSDRGPASVTLFGGLGEKRPGDRGFWLLEESHYSHWMERGEKSGFPVNRRFWNHLAEIQRLSPERDEDGFRLLLRKIRSDHSLYGEAENFLIGKANEKMALNFCSERPRWPCR